jgi:hypothetical protein
MDMNDIVLTLFQQLGVAGALAILFYIFIKHYFTESREIRVSVERVVSKLEMVIEKQDQLLSRMDVILNHLNTIISSKLPVIERDIEAVRSEVERLKRGRARGGTRDSQGTPA